MQPSGARKREVAKVCGFHPGEPASEGRFTQQPDTRSQNQAENKASKMPQNFCPNKQPRYQRGAAKAPRTQKGHT